MTQSERDGTSSSKLTHSFLCQSQNRK